MKFSDIIELFLNKNLIKPNIPFSCLFKKDCFSIYIYVYIMCVCVLFFCLRINKNRFSVSLNWEWKFPRGYVTVLLFLSVLNNQIELRSEFLLYWRVVNVILKNNVDVLFIILRVFFFLSIHYLLKVSIFEDKYNNMQMSF